MTVQEFYETEIAFRSVFRRLFQKLSFFFFRKADPFRSVVFSLKTRRTWRREFCRLDHRAYFECKRGQLDMRTRIRGERSF